MTPYLDHSGITLYVGDALETLRQLPAESVHCCVTSPPYWGLRDYGTATWEGGDAACDHLITVGGAGKSTLGEASGGHAISPERQRASQERQQTPARGRCPRCGASRTDQQLGLERTPEEYVAKMVAVFGEVRRVLRDDGTLWLNIGDSYVGAPVGSFNGGGFKDKSAATGGRDLSGVASSGILDKTKATGLKPKDLVGIPWRLAFALQADGWYLRSDVIWAKPNPMPESVTDQPTKSHEYLFLLAKSATYYYDGDAIREPQVEPDRLQGSIGTKRDAYREDHGGEANPGYNPNGRNRRTVWEVATAPYKGAHFATFPPALIEPCILAGTPEQGVVLDPFLGSGTTAAVCQDLHRRCVGIELNPKYAKLAAKRCRQKSLMI